jgi:hypothetical protein
VEGVGEQKKKAIRCGACYYSIVLNAHRATSMADTDIDAVRKQTKTYTSSGISIIKDGRCRFTFFFFYFLAESNNNMAHCVPESWERQW